MSFELKYFLLVLGLTAVVGAVVSFLTREITFFGVGTNNEKQVKAAASSHLWRWPSDMHQYTKDKARMKDVGVLALAGMQRLLRDRETEYPLIAVCNFSACISAVLIYLVATHCWNATIGFYIFALYLFSFWPHQITLQSGYQCLAQMFCLASIYCLQQTSLIFYFVAGIFFGCMMFASASGRKFIPLLVGAGVYYFSRELFVFRALLCLGLGFGVAVSFFILPNVIENLKGYWSWWNISKNACHFRLYTSYFKKIDKPIPDDFRGAGWKWVALYFFRIIPIPFVLYLASSVAIVALIFKSGKWWQMWSAVYVLFLSASPILYGEWTRSPQLGRAYFPGFLGMLLWIGFVYQFLLSVLSHESAQILWGISAIALLVHITWNAWIFFSDILPARMAVTHLGSFLKKHNVQKFYTYDIPFNDAFVKTLAPTIKNNCSIQNIQRLDEVKEGYVVVPGTSAKAFNMECYPEAINNCDYDADPFLNHLLKTKKIEQCSVASFKTFGSSRIWVHESEMPTYRELVLKDIGKLDRWRGRAWILDAAVVHKMIPIV